ncbi:MAG: MFS transporter [Sporolactobacillus sp.]
MALQNTTTLLEQKSVRQIRKAVTSDFIGNFSSSLFNFAISLYILKLTGSAISFGTTLLVGTLVGIVFSPLIGYVSDHFENKHVMIISQSACALLLFIYSLLFPTFDHWYFLILLIIVGTMGLNTRIFSVTYMAAVSRLVDKPFIQKLNALEQSAASLGMIVGPIAAGVLFAFIPFTWFINFEIVAELLVVLIVSTMNFHLIADETIEAGSENMWTAMKQGIIYIKKRPLILYMILLASMLNFLCGVFNVGFPYLIVHVLHLANFQYSLTEAVFSLGLVAGGLAASKLTVEGNPIRMVSRLLALEGLPLVFAIIPLLFSLNSWTATSIFSLIYFAMAVMLVYINVPLQTYMQQTIPANYQGRVFTIMMAGCTSLQPLGMFIYGVLFQYVSPSAVILVTFAGFLAIGLSARSLGNKEISQSI